MISPMISDSSRGCDQDVARRMHGEDHREGVLGVAEDFLGGDLGSA